MVAIQTLYSKIIHVTCLAHALRSLAEKLRDAFPDVDKVVFSNKQAFRQCI